MNLIRTVLIIAVIFCIDARSACAEMILPFCSNRTINEVTTRVGCTVGDAKCWLTKGGFCTDYVQKKLNLVKTEKEIVWIPVQPVDVRTGDIATFNYLAHYAYVESVVRDKKGKPVAVNVTEYNFGTCLVDEQAMVTDRYKKVGSRLAIPISEVDGGFLRQSR